MAAYNKKYRDRNRTAVTFSPGDSVLVYDPVSRKADHQTHVPRKLTSPFSEPRTVIRHSTPNTCVVRDSGGPEVNVNVNRLHLYTPWCSDAPPVPVDFFADPPPPVEVRFPLTDELGCAPGG